MIDDVLIVGAGPAGAIAATVLARAGARVRIIDRASFPRDKLCGDSLNPGTLALLRRLQLSSAIERVGWRVDGMLITGVAGARIVSVEARYPRNLAGRSISRRDLDSVLVQEAVNAGAVFEPGVTVTEPVVADGAVRGVRAKVHGVPRTLPARVTIAADGRRSILAARLGLARIAGRPRRWAVGAYLEQPGPLARFGEMHIRAGRYIGVAPVPGGAVNVCVVRPAGAADRLLKDPRETVRQELARDPVLHGRFANAPLVRDPMVLGPLAIEATGESVDGLIAAGDAAGFIDPMTGDGLRFAMCGGELAALAALRALARGWAGVHAALADQRRREFGMKWRFNRTLRALVASAAATRAAAELARIAPGAVAALVGYAGDCHLADFETVRRGVAMRAKGLGIG